MILVTGGTGFVGRRVVAALAARRQRVRVMSRSDTTAHAGTDGVEFVQASLLDRSSLERAVDGVDSVIHLAAALAGDRVHDINVLGARALAAAARTAGVQRFLHCSSGGVYGDGDQPAPHREIDAPHPFSPYERLKLDGERAVIEVLESAMPWIVLRPTGVYGPGRRATATFFAEVQRRSWWLHGPATVLLHPTYVDDVVDAVLAVVDRPGLAGAVINIGGERTVTYADLIDLTADALDTSARHIRLPSIVTTVAAGAHRLGVLPARAERLARRVINRTVDTTTARHLLNFQPIPLAEGIARTVAALRHESLP